jgi:NADH-quinone oxidoreductase subunit J/NAD(P)H-quinone oxidoreductase subunit 6
LIGLGAGGGLGALLVDAYRWSVLDLPPAGTAARLGEAVFREWVLPFEVLSVLLLAALVGAIVVSRPDAGAGRMPRPRNPADESPDRTGRPVPLGGADQGGGE